MVAMGLSHVPFSTAISGCRMPLMAGAFLAASVFSCASMVNPAKAATATTRIIRFIFRPSAFASVSHLPGPQATLSSASSALSCLLCAYLSDLCIAIFKYFVIFHKFHAAFDNCATVARCAAVSYTHLRAHETRHDLVCRLLLEKT